MTIQEYVDRVNQRYKTGILTEDSYRGDLKILLETITSDVLITYEPDRVACGAPDYIITNRNIFSGGNPHLRSGSRDTRRGDWNMAFNEWTDLSVSGDSTEKAKALYNMAIYYELEDNLDSASYLINQAASYDTLNLVKRYQEEIDERLKKQTTIVRQINSIRHH